MKNTVTTQKPRLKKNMPTLVILIISGAFIYALPYFRNYYYDTFVAAFNINNTQMGALGSIYGITSMISFCFGGFCADRWQTKHLLSLSLVSTGLLGLVLLLYPPYPVVFIIHGLWGFTCVLTFWNALIITIRSLASGDEQGKAFGFFEGGRGIVNIVQSAFVISLFSFWCKRSTEKFALSSIIISYSVICIVLGIAVYFMLNSTINNITITKTKAKIINTHVLKKIAKMPTTWLCAFMIFTSYAVIISYYYITPYATSVFGLSAVLAAALGYLSQYCRPISCFFTGFMADKIGSSKMMAYLFIVLASGLIGITLVPGRLSLLWLVIIFISAVYLSMYGIQSLHYAILEEGDYPLQIMGTATAIIMPIGYSSEFFIPITAGYCLDKWPGETGYKIFFLILITMCILGFISVLVWRYIVKPNVKYNFTTEKKVL